jgi:cellulase
MLIQARHQHNTRDCTTEGIGGAHWGPVLAYMGKVEDASSADGSGEFFKVYQNGWAKAPGATQGDNDFWGTKDLNYNCGKLDFKIPSDIAPGDYLLRAEAIALHAAGPAGGAQHYVTCYQLTVTGSGTASPAGVTFPEAYSKTGPGLGFSIHANLDSYPMPGPELIASGTEATPQLLTFGKISGSPATGGGASKPVSSQAAAPASSTAAAAPASSSVAVAAPASSSAVVAAPAASSPVAEAITTPAGNSTVEPTPIPAPVEPSSAPALTPPVVSSNFSTTLAPVAPTTLATSVRPKPTEGASSGSIKEYAQCGGSGFQGASACAAGLECKEWNPYYSQCVKSEGGASSPSTTEAAPAPSKTAPAQSEPTVVAPTDDEPSEKTYTLETFVAWLEENAGSANAAMIRRMIEALQ